MWIENSYRVFYLGNIRIKIHYAEINGALAWLLFISKIRL